MNSKLDIRVKPELKSRLGVEAAIEGRSVSGLVVHVLSEYLDEREHSRFRGAWDDFEDSQYLVRDGQRHVNWGLIRTEFEEGWRVGGEISAKRYASQAILNLPSSKSNPNTPERNDK